MNCKSDVSPHNVSSTADKSTLIVVEKSAWVSLSSLQKQGMTLTWQMVILISQENEKESIIKYDFHLAKTL